MSTAKKPVAKKAAGKKAQAPAAKPAVLAARERLNAFVSTGGGRSSAAVAGSPAPSAQDDGWEEF